MVKIYRKILKHIIDFAVDQYLVLFFILALGLKLFFINTFVLKISWPFDQYIYGVMFGFISAAVLFSPLFFCKKHKNKLAIILSALITTILLVDVIYFSYFAALPNFGLLNLIGESDGFMSSVSGLVQWWLIFYLFDIVLVIFLLKPFSRRIQNIKEKRGTEYCNLKISFLAVLLILLTFLIALVSVNNKSKLDDIIDSSCDTVGTSQYYGILMAHALDVIRIVKEDTTKLSADQEKDLANWAKTNKPLRLDDSLTGVAKGKNVIMIQIESLGGFVINKSVNGKEITPNINALAKTSQFFPNDRFVIGAGHTSDTDFVANTSYFPLPDAATFVRYGNDNFTSLPKTLISSGYSAFAYHGFNRDFWNRNVALKSIGYQKFYASDNYPKGTTINLGLNDGDFLSATADYINNQPKPSFSYAITLTSHSPFEITDQTKALGLSPVDYPEEVAGYLENINYVDRMLGAFFEKLKSAGLYDGSLIIVYGDHTPVLPAFKAGTVTYDPKTVQAKEVPLIFKLPNSTVSKTYDNQGTHLDIAPTILDLLGIKTDQMMFGRSLFDSSQSAFKICNDQIAVFASSDCKSMLDDEKDKSSMIVRYNQFEKIN